MEPVLAYITKSTLVKDDTDNIARNKLINGPQKAVWNAISGGVGSLPQDPVTLVAWRGKKWRDYTIKTLNGFISNVFACWFILSQWAH